MNQQSEKLITIGITAYNEGDYLLEAWNSVIQQIDNRWNAVMVLDGGADEKTLKYFDDISHPALRKIRLMENHGPYYTRTLAINNAETDWYCHLDADDRFPTSAIKVLNTTIDQESDLDFIRGKSLYFNSNTFYVRDNRELDLNKLAYTLPITGTSPIKVKLFNCIGGYNKDLYEGGADWDFWIGVVEAESKGKYIDEIIYERRIRENSIGDNWVHRRHDVADILIKRHSKYFSNPDKKNACLSKSYELAARENRRIGERIQAGLLANKAIKYGNKNPNLNAIIDESEMPLWRYKLRRIARFIGG